jgi:hypothetical protein
MATRSPLAIETTGVRLVMLKAPDEPPPVPLAEMVPLASILMFAPGEQASQ